MIVPYDENDCRHPTIDNPFMNYTIFTSDKLSACPNEKVKNEIQKSFNESIKTSSDPSDIWNRHITDRNFYTMPNTHIVNNQKDFALWCYGNTGNCKTYGNKCLKYKKNE
jgi:hypothetical protein